MKKITLRLVLALVATFSFVSSYGQTISEKAMIVQKYDKTKLKTLQGKFKKKETEARKNAYAMAQKKGWEIAKKNADGTFDQLVAVSSDGFPIYYSVYNVDAARSTRANHLNSGGTLGLSVDGQNMTAYVWDGGATRTTHVEFDGPGGNNRVSINDGVTTLNSNSFHAQHVTGTIVASGVLADAKGMAPHAKAKTHDWNNDLSEATTEAVNGMLISNHSYGYRADLVPDWYFGAYIDESRDWDNLMYNSPYYLMVVAAGNDGNDNSSNASPLGGNSAFDKLTGHSTSKNNMVVANGQDANVNNDGTLNSIVINSGSSEGPTDDLRIKPDITGNGTGVLSTYDNSDDAYNSISGTSMASPNVAGTLLLLQQHYKNVSGSFMKAATLKGLALHTADDAGIAGPDAVYGWGLMNAKVAAQVISESGNTSRIEELTLSSGQSYSITVDADGVNDLMASISWTDPAGTANTGTTNLSTPVLVNDLDIRVTQNTSSFLPYRLTGVNSNTKADNNVDPYEKVDIANASGSYTVTVTHKGSLQGGSQNFSLIISGIAGQAQQCIATTPTSLTIDQVTDNSAVASWSAVSGASYDLRYRVTGGTWSTVAVAGTSYTLSSLAANTTYEVQVRSKCSDGTTSSYTTTTSFTTSDTIITYCASNGNSVSDEYIGNVSIGSINNTTGASTGGYGDYTSISTQLEKGQSNTISVTPVWTGTKYNEGYSVWIDFNQDGDFDDSGEQVWTKAVSQDSPVTGSFTVPATATEGTTRMRVSMKYNGIPTACESFSYGEVEDYTVEIVPDNGGPDPTPVYCGSEGSDDYYFWIDLVEVGSMSNPTGQNGGYADYTSLTGGNLGFGDNTIYLSAGYRSTLYTVYWSVWVDFNKDGDFEDANELVIQGSSSSDGRLSATATVPTTASSGQTRMRVAMKYGSVSTPCETFTYGEVEDYTVNIGGTSPTALATDPAQRLGATMFSPSVEYKVYPNPASQRIQVQAPSFNDETSTVKVYNISGRLVKSLKVVDMKGGLDISSLDEGVYFIRLENELSSKTLRFIKGNK
ncbi:GEVED domain-containing protein [Algivirga pacifica]|uniref:Fibronectin type-III domain-containing protein n=1 Tax=Algivirga pacifica TaxID=1162670 RepID=A0ABP9D6A3_9BACT